jgi:sec-independent protein translocase protein TatA
VGLRRTRTFLDRQGAAAYAADMPSFVAPWELIIVGVLLLLLFGPSKLPELGRAAGDAMREVKGTVREITQDEPPAKG